MYTNGERGIRFRFSYSKLTESSQWPHSDALPMTLSFLLSCLLTNMFPSWTSVPTLQLLQGVILLLSRFPFVVYVFMSSSLSRVCVVCSCTDPHWDLTERLWRKTKFHLGALNTQFDSLVFHCLLPSIASCVCSPMGIHCLFLHVYESVHLCERSISVFGAQAPFQVHRYSPSPQRWNQGLFFLDEVLKVYVSFISRVFPPQIIPRM